jgi:tetratricopeptide (TPR) repeat protein
MHPAVYEREAAHEGSFLTEFRPCAVLFVNFTGIDYDSDDAQAQLDAFIRQLQGITACRALYGLGDVNWRLGKLDHAKVALNESLMLAREIGNVTRELFALNRLGVVAVDQKNWDAAEQLFTEVNSRAAAVGNRARAMAALSCLGAVADRRHNIVAAQAYTQQSLALAREIGAQQPIATSLINLACSDIEFGQFTAARAKLREGLALALRLGALPWVLTAMVDFAELSYAEGQIERALALLGLARRHVAWSGDLQLNLDEDVAKWALDPSVLEAGLNKGEELDWEETVKELMQG